MCVFRRLQEEEQQYRTSSLPAIPNPFPELCSPAGSPTLCPGSLPPSQPSGKYPGGGMLSVTSEEYWSAEISRKFRRNYCPDVIFISFLLQIIKIFSEDGMGKVVEIPADMTARDLCQLLVYKSHCVDDNSWALVEHHPVMGLERCLEDHELVVQVQASMTSESRFLFRKNYAKYEFFRNPLSFFPEQMVAWCQESNRTIPPSQLLQEPRHLQLLADHEDSNIFTVISGRKLHNAPTEYEFCIKPNKVRTEQKELRMLCAEDEQSRTCWMTAFRLFKYGILLYQNYKIPQPRKALISHFSTPVRSVSENSLVAMDFSGRIGRVIDNPVEAQSAALEEGHAWRKRSQRMNTLGSPSPLHPSSLSGVIHVTQLWFHGRITREESHRIIHQQGQVDGLFLLRDSQSNPKAFVLTLCHHQKIKHFQILPCEEDGQMFFSLDDGTTKFTDLIQLVEFYQLNRGVLPCKLKHPCTIVAL
uniref:Growth factor receptor-bound protein 10b n=1 Tax=Astyanax mexicanus TaxID=7994 RepID=A0A8B9KH21_ASTMX